jgi:hypothetical protein
MVCARHRIPTEPQLTILYDVLLHIPRMGSDFDPQSQAEAAIREAVHAVGPERQRLIQVAQAWLELARGRLEPDGKAAFANARS